MIAANHEDFPELRLQFFSLLKAINQHSFPSLFAIPQEVRKNVVDAVAFAIKHTERNIAEMGLDILFELLQNVGRHEHIAQEFYQQFLPQLIQEVLYVMTDRLHKSVIKMHNMLLREMLHLVEMGKVELPPFDPPQHAPARPTRASWTNRPTDGQAGRQVGRPTDRQTDCQTGRQAGRQTRRARAPPPHGSTTHPAAH